MTITWLYLAPDRKEPTLWRPWLDLVAPIRDQYGKAFDGDDLFFYNETASVGVLAGAASRAGFLALSEYSATKRGKGRGRPHRRGRCDLWVALPNGRLSWAFEMKQMFCRDNVRFKTLSDCLDRACADADEVHPLEADHCFGGLLVSATAEGCLTQKAIDAVVKLAKASALACRFDGGCGPVWLILKQVK